MASAFSFGFSGDDIDIDVDDSEVETGKTNDHDKQNAENTIAPKTVFPAVRHALSDWTTSLPSQISYNVLALRPLQSASNMDNDENNKTPIRIARRELFDIRTQLMAEDDEADIATDNAELIAGLEQGDLKPNFYEGGFKTWECSLDLADVLQSSEEVSAGLDTRNEDFHVIELGCGTAVPSLMLFARVLISTNLSKDGQASKKYHFTMGDYNSTVLRMVTFCNFLLTWWINSSAAPGGTSTTGTEGGNGKEFEEGELDIDAALLDSFQNDLEKRGIEIEFISGGWSPDFVKLALQGVNKSTTLILASETIYSPASLGVFSETLLELLRSSGEPITNKSMALIAAKKVYFGVGGGVDEFLQVLKQQVLQDKESVRVQERREITSGGVKRVVLDIGIERI